MGICSMSKTLLIVPVTIPFVACTSLTSVFVLCPSILIISLNVSHSLSSSVLTDGGWMMRGEGSSSGEIKACCYGSSFDLEVSLTDPSLLSWPLSDLLKCSNVSFPDLDLDLSVRELPLRLILEVGSLMGSKHSSSKAILINLLSLYIFNS